MFNQKVVNHLRKISNCVSESNCKKVTNNLTNHPYLLRSVFYVRKQQFAFHKHKIPRLEEAG